MSSIRRISFVWNADFSLAGGVRALQELSAGEHSCSLCEIAYHRVMQTGDWKAYKKELGVTLGAEIREPCRNQLKPALLAAASGDFPAVLATTGAGVVRLLGGAEIDDCNGSFDAFREKLDAAIRDLQSP